MKNSIERDIHLLESYAGMTHKMTDNQGRPKLDQAIERVLLDYKRVLKENEELKNIDLTTVYLKGVSDEKDRWRKKIKRKIDELRIQVTSKEFTHDMYMGTEKFIMFTKLCAMGEVLQDLLKEE